MAEGKEMSDLAFGLVAVFGGLALLFLFMLITDLRCPDDSRPGTVFPVNPPSPVAPLIWIDEASEFTDKDWAKLEELHTRRAGKLED